MNETLLLMLSIYGFFLSSYFGRFSMNWKTRRLLSVQLFWIAFNLALRITTVVLAFMHLMLKHTLCLPHFLIPSSKITTPDSRRPTSIHHVTLVMSPPSEMSIQITNSLFLLVSVVDVPLRDMPSTHAWPKPTTRRWKKKFHPPWRVSKVNWR